MADKEGRLPRARRWPYAGWAAGLLGRRDHGVDGRMTTRLATALLVVWWIATPSVCGAFLSSASCRPGASQDIFELPVAPEMPCHAGSEQPVPGPVEGEEDGSCCGTVNLAASAKLVKDVQPGLPSLPAQLERAHASQLMQLRPAVGVADQLHSPYRQVSPPLRN
jgi:hypothetical protein